MRKDHHYVNGEGLIVGTIFGGGELVATPQALARGRHVHVAVDTDYRGRYCVLTTMGGVIGPRLEKQLPMPAIATRGLKLPEAEHAMKVWNEYIERQNSLGKR